MLHGLSLRVLFELGVRQQQSENFHGSLQWVHHIEMILEKTWENKHNSHLVWLHSVYKETSPMIQLIFSDLNLMYHSDVYDVCVVELVERTCSGSKDPWATRPAGQLLGVPVGNQLLATTDPFGGSRPKFHCANAQLNQTLGLESKTVLQIPKAKPTKTPAVVGSLSQVND